MALESIPRTLTGTMFGYVVGSYGRDIVTSVNDKINSYIVTSIILNRDNNVRAFPLINYLNEVLHPNTNQRQLNSNKYSIPNGCYILRYKFNDDTYQYIRVSIDDKTITVYNYIDLIDLMDDESYKLGHRINMKILDRFVNEIFEKAMSPTDNIIQFLLEESGKYGNPITSRHREIKNLTHEMTQAIDLISGFLKPDTEVDYRSKGIIYKYGLLLCGQSRCGKTTIAHYIAQKYQMYMYCIYLIANNMTDGTLIKSLTDLERNSLIVIDEFDKAYHNMVTNPKSKITMAGILSFLDGLIKLPHGSICIIIMNGKLNDVITNQSHRDSLISRSRLDQWVEFNTPYIL